MQEHVRETKEPENSVLSEERLGPFLKYLKDDNVTDVDCPGSPHEMWIKTADMKKTKVHEPELTTEFITAFTQNVANSASNDSITKFFNRANPKLEVDMDDYRITCVHESIAPLGRACCIRKTTKKARLDYQKVIEQGYCDKRTMNLLVNSVLGKFNLLICGEPGLGKTEFAKMLSLYTPDEERVITIEDVNEWHYKWLKPEADCISLKVSDKFDYSEALKLSLRLNPDRIMLAEVRSVEVKHLVECWQGGLKGLTTIHTDSITKIVDRMLNMMPSRRDAERMENDIYDNLDIAIHICRRYREDGTEYRYIDEVGFFARENEQNLFVPYLIDGKVINDIPEYKLKKLKNRNILDPFHVDEEIANRRFVE